MFVTRGHMMVATTFGKVIFFPLSTHTKLPTPPTSQTHTTMSSTRQLISRETLYRIIDIWAAEYHQALGNCAAYGSKHFGFYQDARKILRQVRAAEIEGTIFDYIVEVLRDTSKRGYDDELHYPGLKKGYLAWACGEQPAPAWNPAGGLPPLPEIPPIRSSKEVSKQSTAVDLLEKTLEELEESKRGLVSTP